MKRNQNKKRRLRTASVGKNPGDDALLNETSGQGVSSWITTPDPREVESWMAGIRGERHTKRNLYVAIIGIPLMIFCAWFFSPKDRGSAAINLQNERPVTGAQPESNNQKTLAAPSPLPSQPPISAPNSDNASSSGTSDTPTIPKPGNEALVAAHLTRAHSLHSQKRYSAALAECDRALQLDGTNKKARALRAKIIKILTAEILEENDKPDH